MADIKDGCGVSVEANSEGVTELTRSISLPAERMNKRPIGSVLEYPRRKALRYKNASIWSDPEPSWSRNDGRIRFDQPNRVHKVQDVTATNNIGLSRSFGMASAQRDQQR